MNHLKKIWKIDRIIEIIHNAKPNTPFEELPTTSEIAHAYGYDPEILPYMLSLI
ncbi:MAG: hypothetical protein WA421_05325 [Nitrososphaeraceae archaeon]